MADAHEVKLVVTADTSDAQRRIQDVANVKVAPVTPEVRKPDPVRVEVQKPDPVTPEVRKPDPVRVEVQKPDPVRVEVEKPAPVKIEVEQPKPVTIQTRVENSAVGRLVKSLHGVNELVGRVMGAFGVFGLAVNGVRAVIDGVKALHAWLNKAREEAKALQEELERSHAEAEAARAASAYDKLVKKLAEVNALEKERNEILAKRRSSERDLEDAKTERSRQLEIAKLDPAAKDYDERRKEIDRRYEAEASRTSARRAGEDVRAESRQLYGQAEAKDREAVELQKKLRNAEQIEGRAVERNWRAGMEARQNPEDEDAKKRKEDAENQWKAAHDFARTIREQMDAAQKEAAALRRRAAELTGGDTAARIRDEATQRRIEAEAARERAEKAKRDEDAAKASAKADADWKRQRTEGAERRDLDKAVEAERTPANKATMLKAAEETQRLKAEAERKRYDAEMAKPAAERDESALAEMRSRISAAEDAANALRDRREATEKAERDRRISELEPLADRAASADGVSQNRLTAMGLGSGVSARGTVASDVKRLVELMKTQIEATKANKPEAQQPAVAVYGE